MTYLKPLIFGLSVTLAPMAQADYTELFEISGINSMMSTMALEGQGYGADMARDFFDETVPRSWQPAVDTFYNADAMQKILLGEFTIAADGARFDALTEFFQSDLGEMIVGLETSARLAMIDPEIEDQTRQFYEQADPGTPRYKLVEGIIEGLDMIEGNVTGSMNSNIAFYRGLASLPGMYDLTEMEILDEVRGQEDSIRANSTAWLYSYYLFAMSQLSDDQLDTYRQILISDEGRAFNRALFTGFDVLFERIMFGLGHTIASASRQQDL